MGKIPPPGNYTSFDVPDLLDNIGLSDGLLVESICTTKNGDGSLHSAPIGVRRAGSAVIIEKLFKGTTTLENLMREGFALINLLDDVEIFYLATFNEIPEEGYDMSHGMRLPPLKDSNASMEASLLNFEDKGEFLSVKLSIDGIFVRKVKPCFFTRCNHAVLESLIHATRIPVFRRIMPKDAEKLTKLVLHYSELVSRICPEEPYNRIMRDVVSRLNIKLDE